MGEKTVFIKYYSENENSDSYIAKSELIEISNNDNQTNDTEGPSISFLLNDINLESNSHISINSNVTVQITDEIGINTSSSIGHGTKYGFNNINELNYLIENEDYTFLESCNGISFDIILEDLADNTKIFIESWDNANNKSLDSLSLNIISKFNDDKIFNVYNFPNPFSNRTFFTYQIKDFPLSGTIYTELNIYTQNGMLVNTINDNSNSLNNFISIEWDGKDSKLNFLPNGTYLYTLKITFDNNSYEKMGVLSIIK